MDRRTDRQTDRHTYRLTNRQTDGERDGQTNGHWHGQIEGQKNRQMGKKWFYRTLHRARSRRCVCVWGSWWIPYLFNTLYSNIKFSLDREYLQAIIKKKWKSFFFNVDIYIWLTPLPPHVCSCLLWLTPLPPRHGHALWISPIPFNVKISRRKTTPNLKVAVLQ